MINHEVRSTRKEAVAAPKRRILFVSVGQEAYVADRGAGAIRYRFIPIWPS